MRRASASLVALVLAAGCVSTSGLSTPDGGTSDDGGATDAGLDGATTDGGTDAGSDSGPFTTDCDPNKPFGTMQPFSPPIDQSGSDELAGTFSRDRLRFYFASTRTTSGALFVVERATTSSPWGAATLLDALDSTSTDNDPSLSPDETTIFFDSKRNGNEQVWMATRSDRTSPFSSPILVPGLIASGRTREPWVTSDGSRLYFASDRATGNPDIFIATKDASGAFGGLTTLDTLNSAGSDDEPVTTDDELTIYFASDRPGGTKDYDVFVAHRANAGAAFGAPTKVDELSTAKDDYVTWVAPDGCAVVVESYVNGGADLYFAQKPK